MWVLGPLSWGAGRKSWGRAGSLSWHPYWAISPGLWKRGSGNPPENLKALCPHTHISAIRARAEPVKQEAGWLRPPSRVQSWPSSQQRQEPRCTHWPSGDQRRKDIFWGVVILPPQIQLCQFQCVLLMKHFIQGNKCDTESALSSAPPPFSSLYSLVYSLSGWFRFWRSPPTCMLQRWVNKSQIQFGVIVVKPL